MVWGVGKDSGVAVRVTRKLYNFYGVCSHVVCNIVMVRFFAFFSRAVFEHRGLLPIIGSSVTQRLRS